MGGLVRWKNRIYIIGGCSIATVDSLVGGFNPSEKYEFVSCSPYSQYMESHKIPWFQSPPTSSIFRVCLPYTSIFRTYQPRDPRFSPCVQRMSPGSPASN